MVDRALHGEIVARVLGFVLVDDRQRGVVRHLEPGADFQRTLGTQIVFLVGFVADAVDTVHVVETARHIIIGILVAARNREVVLVREVPVLVEQVQPVGRLHVGPSEHRIALQRRGPRKRRVGLPPDQLLIDRLRIGHRTVDMAEQGFRAVVITVVRILPPVDPRQAVGDDVGNHRTAVEGDRTVVVDLGGTPLGALGRDQHHAEGAARTVYGRRRGIFEHRDRLHVLRVDRIHAALHAVDEHQRIAARSDRSLAADVERRRTRRLAVGEGDVQARQLALKRARQIAVRAVSDHPAVDLIHGSDQIAPLHRTVAHDHHFVERRGVLFQTDIERRAAGRGDLLPGIAQERHFERTAGGDREREASVDIGRRTDGAALDEHRGADDGFAGRIGHRTRDGLFRRRSRGGVRGRLRLPAQHDMFSFERETDRRALEDTSEHRLHGFVVRGYRDAEIDLFAAVYEQVVGLPFDFVENLPDGSFFPVERHRSALGVGRTCQRHENRTGTQDSGQAPAYFFHRDADTGVFIHTFAE